MRTPALLAKPGPWWQPHRRERGARIEQHARYVHGDQDPLAPPAAEYARDPDTVQAAMATIRADLAAHQPRPARPAPLGTRRLIEGGGQ